MDFASVLREIVESNGPITRKAIEDFAKRNDIDDVDKLIADAGLVTYVSGKQELYNLSYEIA